MRSMKKRVSDKVVELGWFLSQNYQILGHFFGIFYVFTCPKSIRKT